MCAKSLQLCDPMDCSPPGSSVHGISQTRILECDAISFFSGIFPHQKSNLCLLYGQVASLPLNHQGSPYLCLSILIIWRRKWQPTPVFLPGESQGQGILVGCCLWGRTESDTTAATWQQQQQQHTHYLGFPGGSDDKASACNAGDPGSIPGSGRSPEEGSGNPLQYSCLENSMDGGDW